MDRPLDPGSTSRRMIVLSAGAAAVILLLVLAYHRVQGASQTVSIPRSAVSLGLVVEGEFGHSTSLFATVEPADRIILSSSVGGTILEVDAVLGQRLEKGDTIASLTNPILEMELLARESEVAQQIANLNNQILDNHQRGLDNTLLMADAENIFADATSAFERSSVLFDARHVSAQTMETLERDLAHAGRRVEMLRGALEEFDASSRESRRQLEGAVARLQRGLEVARASAEQLVIRAPLSGVLMSLSAEKGQFVEPGASVGVLGNDSRVKLVSSVDEFYLNRVRPGLAAVATVAGASVPLTVDRVSGAVADRKFTVEMVAEDVPRAVSLGQSVPVVLRLGAGLEQAVSVPVGPYLVDTRGEWAFVVPAGSSRATRREIKLGDRNERQVVVLSGMVPGDSVIVSSYRDLLDYRYVELES